MIRNSLERTKQATFAVCLPNAARQGMPTPSGTGFFVSADGWFITAAHVVTTNGAPDGPVRTDISSAWLMKESRVGQGSPGAMCQSVSLASVLPHIDLALLKVDFSANANKAWLQSRSDFPFLQICIRELEEAHPVYAFGYPLSSSSVQVQPGLMVGSTSLCPRVTSAIVASTLDATAQVMTASDPRVYVLDKALNYGNSGGPIVSSESGMVHALCSRFQPVYIPQNHLLDSKGKPTAIMIPSLYGVVSSLSNSDCVALFNSNDISVVA